MTLNLNIAALRRRYLDGSLTPKQLVEDVDAAIGSEDVHHIWIRRLSHEEMLAYAMALEGKNPADYPLYGIPFAIKDNIDLAGISTTAACPDFAYVPEKSATVVQKLIDAGAIPVGKTNLDQFATGLVGVRSPYGAGRNAFDPDYISGGSSAGSAVAVALGLASFSLGTDTAGSGRVPAAFNNLVGHKPTCGLLSTSGVVPACRTLDCVSIFALTSDDAATVLEAAQGFDAADPYSRVVEKPSSILGSGFKFGVPKPEQLAFFGNPDTPQLFKDAVEHLRAIGGEEVEIDFQPFLDTARLLYEGPWVAERYAAIREFIENQPDAMFPVTRQIIGGAVKFSAADTFTALYRLKAMQRLTAGVWDDVDVIVTPTAGTIYRIEEVGADPVKTNSNLGYYTNFMNLLDLSAVAIPAGFQANGLPFGITLCAPAFNDARLLNLAARATAGQKRFGILEQQKTELTA
ncbi:allophanate hydrolase [Novimethylophilus kurashikiensis]|uniref:Allophanate hydrolase n=1 Tax=Novimethylophilus kurashikiensis TaxID=1825523 RepID=A0A2R5F6M4_9PROT|nr:allophanate hydrolase [Novimethylophilus kurashikiensis]GBG13867.1 allophanate hydrolase [Novimethylophilus kurashikiensis]